MYEYVIYGRNDCPYCLKAIQLCTEAGASFSFINMTSQGLSKASLGQQLGREVRTVPQVLLNGAYIGGCDSLEEHMRRTT